MKIIISRKGFDSAAGGCPSPIFPDGRFFSLPIPTREAPSRFQDLKFDEHSVGDLVASLTDRKYGASSYTHVDPDLSHEMMERPPGWRPAFGQVDAAQSHLVNNEVGVGDLFLFFGWFRNVAPGNEGGWAFKHGSPHQHVLFGWLQVDEILRVGSNTDKFRDSHPWLVGHPHLHGTRNMSNTIYVASDKLSLPGMPVSKPGGGTFRSVRPELILTAPGQPKRSVWTLPAFFSPNGRKPLSYHSAPTRWADTKDGKVRLESVGRGQEFVLDTDDYPEAIAWAATLISGS